MNDVGTVFLASGLAAFVVAGSIFIALWLLDDK